MKNLALVFTGNGMMIGTIVGGLVIVVVPAAYYMVRRRRRRALGAESQGGAIPAPTLVASASKSLSQVAEKV